MDATEKALFALQVRNCASELAQSGTAALARLFDLTAPRLVRYAVMLTRSQEDAEDAVQAAMVRITLKPKLLGEAWHPWPYFLRVVRNEALKVMRRTKPLPLEELAAEDEGHPASGLVEAETKNSVQAAIQMLPAEQAEVVLLKIWEEMTFIEIAEVLGESPNTVASRYRYALQKLSQTLHPLSHGVTHA